MMMIWFRSVQNRVLVVYPSMISILSSALIPKSSSFSHEITDFQKSWLALPSKNKCSRDSSASSQKEHEFEFVKFILYSRLFVYTMQSSPLLFHLYCFECTLQNNISGKEEEKMFTFPQWPSWLIKILCQPQHGGWGDDNDYTWLCSRGCGPVETHKLTLAHHRVSSSSVVRASD